MRGLRRVLLGILITVAVLYAAICVVLFAYQRSLIYFPRSAANQTGITLLLLDTPSGRAVVSTRLQPGPDALLYFGGNGEDVSLDMPDLAATFPEHSIYLFNYPGYGGSAGRPSEHAIMEGALALFDRVHADHVNLVVIGRSLGTGVAVHLASVRPVFTVMPPIGKIEEFTAKTVLPSSNRHQAKSTSTHC